MNSFSILKTYNIIQVLQYKINHAMQILLRSYTLLLEVLIPSRSREAFYIWLFAGLQYAMLAVLSRVLL